MYTMYALFFTDPFERGLCGSGCVQNAASKPLPPLCLSLITDSCLHPAQVKKQTDKFRGATVLAKEILAKYELPKSFSPPYDPGLQMGDLNIDKCRAMDSKKVCMCVCVGVCVCVCRCVCGVCV